MFFDASGLFGAHPVLALLDGDRDEPSWGKQRKFPDGWAFEFDDLDGRQHKLGIALPCVPDRVRSRRQMSSSRRFCGQ